MPSLGGEPSEEAVEAAIAAGPEIAVMGCTCPWDDEGNPPASCRCGELRATQLRDDERSRLRAAYAIDFLSRVSEGAPSETTIKEFEAQVERMGREHVRRHQEWLNAEGHWEGRDEPPDPSAAWDAGVEEWREEKREKMRPLLRAAYDFPARSAEQAGSLPWEVSARTAARAARHHRDSEPERSRWVLARADTSRGEWVVVSPPHRPSSEDGPPLAEGEVEAMAVFEHEAALEDQERIHIIETDRLKHDLSKAQRKLMPNKLAHPSTAPECCGSWAVSAERSKSRAEKAEAALREALDREGRAVANMGERAQRAEAALADAQAEAAYLIDQLDSLHRASEAALAEAGTERQAGQDGRLRELLREAWDSPDQPRPADGDVSTEEDWVARDAWQLEREALNERVNAALAGPHETVQDDSAAVPITFTNEQWMLLCGLVHPTKALKDLMDELGPIAEPHVWEALRAMFPASAYIDPAARTKRGE